MFVKSRTDW